MVEVVGAVGATVAVVKALGSLYDAVVEVKGNSAIFEPTRIKLEERLVKLKSLINEVNQLSKLLHQTDDQAADLESEINEGEKLVRECSQVSSWNLYKKNGYAPKLLELDETLKNLTRYCYMARESKEMLLRIRNIDAMTARDGVNATSMVFIPYDDEIASSYHVSAPGSRHGDQVQGDNGLLSGAVLEEALRSVLDAAKEVKVRDVMFKTTLSSLNVTLEYLKPLITEFNMPEEEATKFQLEMEKGAELVRKCSRVHRSNFCTKNCYTAKLRKLDKTLKKLLNDVENIYKTSMGNGAGSEYYQIISMVSSGGPQLPSITVGLDAPLINLKGKLLNENGTSIVLVTAPQGCGKTLLAQTFCRDVHVRDKFKSNIFFVTISKTPPGLILIVQELYKYKMNTVPLLQNEADATKRLKQFLNTLKSSPILMVLDDVWPGAESLIEKFVFEMRDYKILITSRSDLPKFRPPEFALAYRLSPLNDEDATTLFRHSAYLEDGEPGIPDHIVKKMVDFYKRIPLAIIIVAKSLIGQPVEIWQKRLKEYSDDSSSTPGSENELVASLISGLGYLKVLVKECFKDLASFPENWMIPVAALIDMWTELYELVEVHVLDIISDLTAKNLADLKMTRKDVKEVDDYYGQHFLILHGLLRDLAKHMSSQEPIGQRKRLFIDVIGNNFPRSFEECMEQPVSASLASISTDEMFSSNWLDMQLHEAEVLVLNFRTKDYALPKFVGNMKNLKALIATSSLNYAELSNFQLLGSLTNLKRMRLERISIPYLSKNPVPLKNLHKISLYMCRFDEAFSNCSIQISDLLPNLSEMNVDFCEDLVKLPAGLYDIVHLKKLSITHCYKLSGLPNEIGKLVNLKVLRLRSSTALEELPDSIRCLSKLITLDISDCIRLQDLPEHIGDLHQLTNLNISHCSRLQYLPESFWDLEQSLDLVCDKELKEVWENFYPFPPNITMRSVKEDINLEWLRTFS